ncbi:DNA-processing protein DprA [Nocardia africana]|uniref:DNA-processing protein DprA n=1 Tax=Nocardia africana TaxID=134964 RepID=A0ABW6NQV9_9NOCA
MGWVGSRLAPRRCPAAGIDTAAMKARCRRRDNTIAVMGTGIERVYPDQNAALAKRITSSGMWSQLLHSSLEALGGQGHHDVDDPLVVRDREMPEVTTARCCVNFPSDISDLGGGLACLCG